MWTETKHIHAARLLYHHHHHHHHILAPIALNGWNFRWYYCYCGLVGEKIPFSVQFVSTRITPNMLLLFLLYYETHRCSVLTYNIHLWLRILYAYTYITCMCIHLQHFLQLIREFLSLHVLFAIILLCIVIASSFLLFCGHSGRL